MKLIEQDRNLSASQIIGALLLAIGVITLLIVAIYSFFRAAADPGSGALAAVSFFIIMLGMVFFFPDMLKDESNGSVSTMRVVTFMLVSVFVLLAVKIGWSCKTMAELSIDRTWAYILGAALGSKALQSLGENNFLGKATRPATCAFPADGSKDPGADHHDPANISSDVPSTPPPFVK